VRLGWVILYVADVAASVEFYERAFGLSRRFVAEGGDYAELETGSTALAFAAHELAGRNVPIAYRATTRRRQPPAFEVALVTDDVPAAVTRAVEAGAALIAPPHEQPWGQTVAYVRDREGVLVELATPVG
jgi:lactoylglutathione lyase